MVDIPSYPCKPQDVITIRDQQRLRAKNMEPFQFMALFLWLGLHVGLNSSRNQAILRNLIILTTLSILTTRITLRSCGINRAMAVRALMIILEDIFTAVRATSHLTEDINSTRWAGFCAVANLMTAFRALDYHILYIYNY